MSAYYNFNVASSLLSDHLWAQSSGLQRHGSHHGLQAVDGHCKNSCDLKITVRSTTMLLGLPWFTFTQSFSMLLSQVSYILTAVVVLHLDCTPDLELLYRASFQLVNSDRALPSYWKPIWFAKEAELVAVACRAQSIPVVKVIRAKKREDMRTVRLFIFSARPKYKESMACLWIPCLY